MLTYSGIAATLASPRTIAANGTGVLQQFPDLGDLSRQRSTQAVRPYLRPEKDSRPIDENNATLVHESLGWME